MARRTVLVTSDFLFNRRDAWDDGYEIVRPSDLSGATADRIEVVVCGGDALDRKLIEALPNLKLVACFSTGYEGIDLAHLRSRGITLTSAGGVNAHDVADHAMALMLAWWHNVPHADRAVRGGQWRGVLIPRASLQGKRLGIVGMGRVGMHVASRAEAFAMRVQWWGPREKPGVPYARAQSLVDLARDSDVLVITSRSSPANKKQIDADVLAALGPTGLLVNVSRGFLVDERALIDALDRGTIAGAALDVFAQEPPDAAVWNRFSNVVLSPHIAGYTREAGVALFGQVRENLQRYFAGEPLLTPVED